MCSSVNIGATKAGLNMDAIKLMGEAVKKASELTADRQCIGAAKLVVFCNAPEDNPSWPVPSTAPASRTARSMWAFPARALCAPRWHVCPRTPPSTRWQSW